MKEEDEKFLKWLRSEKDDVQFKIARLQGELDVYLLVINEFEGKIRKEGD